MEYGSHMFAIWGAPSGGKTTLAVNMAVLLADSGYMTCLVSCADHGELQTFLSVAVQEGKGLQAALKSGKNVREALTEARPNLCLLELDTGGDYYEAGVAGLTVDMVNKIFGELRDQFSYIIVDCTNYKESALTGLGLGEADKVIVCIPHRGSAATWHFANQQIMESIASKTFYVDMDTREGGCNMEQLLATIDLPECDIKIPCVDSAYYYENTGEPIVLKRGGREKKYKRAVLDLVQFILEVENDERTARKRAKRMKMPMENAPAPTPSGEEGEPKKKGIFGTVKKRPTDGIQKKPMSKRQMKKAEEAAMKRAKQEAERRLLEEEDDEDDEDD